LADLLTNFRTYLVDEGLVRVPSVAGDEPPLWLEPRKGVPAPGEGQNETERGADAVLGAYRAGGIPPASPYEGFIRQDFIEVRIRTRTAQIVTPLEEQLRASFIDVEGGAPRLDWMMADERIIASTVFRELQRLGSDEQSFNWSIEFVFERYATQPA
jgi:hypothetical protein